MDEAYVGGRRKGGGGRRLRGDRGEQYKIVGFGIAERKGRIIAKTVENASGATLLPTVREYVMPKSTVFTDELPSYHGIPHMQDQGYVHRRINHSEKAYVMGDIHTNTVEGFWSLVTRGISAVLSFSWSSLFAAVPESVHVPLH